MTITTANTAAADICTIVCGHIHSTLTVESCAARGCRGCQRHLRNVEADRLNPPASTLDKINAVTPVW